MSFRPQSSVAAFLLLAASIALEAQEMPSASDTAMNPETDVGVTIEISTDRENNEVHPKSARCSQSLHGLEVPFKNCGFEDDFKHWLVTDIKDPFLALRTAQAGEGTEPLLNFFTAQPSQRSKVALSGIDGDGPGAIRIAQDVELPQWATHLRFDYRAAWDLAFGTPANAPRTFRVVFEPSGGGKPLEVIPMLTTESEFDLDTGPQRANIPIDHYAGQSVRVSFEWLIPESRTGPGLFQLDNVEVVPPSRITCGESLRGKLGPDHPTQWFRIDVGEQRMHQTFHLTARFRDRSANTAAPGPQLQLIESPAPVLASADRSDQLQLGLKALAPEQTGGLLEQPVLVTVTSSALTSTTASSDPLAPSSDVFDLVFDCSLGVIDTFADTTASIVANDKVGSARWNRSDACPASLLEGHSQDGAARWGNPSSCSDYATSGATTDVLFQRLALAEPTQSPTCAAARRVLRFNYFLDFEDGPEFDRARVDLSANGASFTTVLDNGTSVGGLLNGTDQWQQATVELPSTPGIATVYALRFIAETSDDLNNYGRGFLIDDVRIQCQPAALTQTGFEFGEPTWFILSPTAAPEAAPP